MWPMWIKQRGASSQAAKHPSTVTGCLMVENFYKKSTSKPLKTKNGIKGHQRRLQDAVKAWRPVRSSAEDQDGRFHWCRCFITVTVLHLLHLNPVKRQTPDDGCQTPGTSRRRPGYQTAAETQMLSAHPYGCWRARKCQLSHHQPQPWLKAEDMADDIKAESKISGQTRLNLSWICHSLFITSLHPRALLNTCETCQQRPSVSDLVGAVQLRKCRHHHRYRRGLSCREHLATGHTRTTLYRRLWDFQILNPQWTRAESGRISPPPLSQLGLWLVRTLLIRWFFNLHLEAKGFFFFLERLLILGSHQKHHHVTL